MDYRTILLINPLSSHDRAHTPRYIITLLGVWTLPGELKGLVVISLFTILIIIEKKGLFFKNRIYKIIIKI